MKYNHEYHDPWAWSLAIKGATAEEIAEAFGVSKRTVIRWTWNSDGTLTSFGEALQSGREAADARVVKKLFERCMGYDFEEEQRIIEVGKDGTNKIGSIKTVKKHVPPDTMAIMYWLNNRSRRTGEWSQRQEVDVSIGTEEREVFIYLPAKESDGDE